MRNIMFVIWMLLFPLLNSLGEYFSFLANGSVVKQFDKDIVGQAALVEVVIWFGIGALLYERKLSSVVAKSDRAIVQGEARENIA